MMRAIALEAQVVRDLSPPDVFHAAARAGFAMAGVWIDPSTWTAQMTRNVRSAIGATGVTALDAEVVRIGDDDDGDHDRLIDIAGEIGVRHVIIVSMARRPQQTIDRLADVAARAQGAGIVPVLEFGRFTTVTTLDMAFDIVKRCDVVVGILPDPLHLHRSGGVPADLALVPARYIPFAQICDAGPAPEPATREKLLWEARHDRRDLGDGLLPLADYVGALPRTIPLSNETRSLRVERAYPDPFDRATALAERMRAMLAIWDHG